MGGRGKRGVAPLSASFTFKLVVVVTRLELIPASYEPAALPIKLHQLQLKLNYVCDAVLRDIDDIPCVPRMRIQRITAYLL